MTFIMELCLLLSPDELWYQSRIQSGHWIALYWYIHVRVHNQRHHQVSISPCIIWYHHTFVATGTPTSTCIRRTSTCIDISSANAWRQLCSGRIISQVLSELITTT